MSQGSALPPHGAPQFRAPAPAAPAAPPLPTAPPLVPSPAGWTGPAPTGGALPTAPTGPGVLAPSMVRPGPPQRPAVVTLACCLSVVASLQWICGLALAWVAAAVATGTFAQIGDDGALFHVLHRFDHRLLDGLAVPLFGFPLLSVVTGFAILSPRPRARLLHTAVGLAALLWAGWWLREDLLWWFSAAWYVVVACAVLWTQGATAWYHQRPAHEGPRPAA